jgi:hypothetical protein
VCLPTAPRALFIAHARAILKACSRYLVRQNVSVAPELHAVTRGWKEEFRAGNVQPQNRGILFHRSLTEGPAHPWQTLGDKEASMALSDAWKAYPHCACQPGHPRLSGLASQFGPSRGPSDE